MSNEIKYTIEPTDVEWEMNWAGVKPDGTRMYPDKPEKEIMFEEEDALALLLINEVIFINDHWWEKEWPEKAKNSTSLNVNCSDIFAWGCSDAEEVSTKEIEVLYRMWKNDPTWGPALWCMIKRREMPQDPVADAMYKDGVDLGSFQKQHNLRINFYSGCGIAQAKFKYESYAAWAKKSGYEVRPFDKHWWAGWKEFSDAHPDWETTVGKDAYKRIRNKFIQENGWEGEVK